MWKIWVGIAAAVLVAAGVFLNKATAPPGSANDQALLKAAADNDLNGLKKALAAGANPNAKVGTAMMDKWTGQTNYEEGNTALIKAAQWGNVQAIGALLDKGADINLPNTLGATPLMAAASTLQTEAVKALLSRGADITKKSKFGATARDLAKKRNVTKASRELEIYLAQELNKAGVSTPIPPPFNPDMAG